MFEVVPRRRCTFPQIKFSGNKQKLLKHPFWKKFLSKCLSNTSLCKVGHVGYLDPSVSINCKYKLDKIFDLISSFNREETYRVYIQIKLQRNLK